MFFFDVFTCSHNIPLSLITISIVTKNLKDFTPIKVYPNFYNDRKQIRKDHKTVKSGIYLFINLKDFNKIYIGQSINLYNRFNNYLSNSYLKSKKNNQVFPRALLKYGQTSFALIIIEYVPITMLDIREIFWISLLKPYYNILPGGKKGGSIPHSKETKETLKQKAIGRKHTAATKALISAANIGQKNAFFGRSHKLDSIKQIAIANSLGTIYIYDKSKRLLFKMVSVLSLAKKTKSNYTTILKYIKNVSLFRGSWYITRLPFCSKETPKYSDIESLEVKEEMLKIINSAHIKKHVFVFNAKDRNFIKKYDGIMACAKDLKISHNAITKYIDSDTVYNGYIFLSYRDLYV